MKTNILDSTVRVGKAGITDSLIEEIKLQLKKKNIIKIKLVKGILEKQDKKTIAEKLAKKTDSELVKLIGFTVVLKKKNIN